MVVLAPVFAIPLSSKELADVCCKLGLDQVNYVETWDGVETIRICKIATWVRLPTAEKLGKTGEPWAMHRALPFFASSARLLRVKRVQCAGQEAWWCRMPLSYDVVSNTDTTACSLSQHT